MERRYNYYRLKIAESEAQVATLQTEKEVVTKTLDNYYTELNALKIKHDYQGKSEKLKALNIQINDAKSTIISNKLLLLLEIICFFVQAECFSSNQFPAWKWLNTVFSIENNSWDYDFDEFLSLLFSDEDIEESVEDYVIFGTEEIKIRDKKYFRGKLDGEFSLVIPNAILEDIENVENSIEIELKKRQVEYKKEVANSTEKAKAERYMLYQKLKSEFDD